MQTVKARGVPIPVLGLGTWELKSRECTRLVEQALRLGYRHIDTAQSYGNESEVGDGLRNSGVPRNDVFVTTKIPWTQLAPKDLIRSAKGSLSKLRLKEVDLLLIHWPNPAVPLADTMGAMAHVKTIGLARHIGVSNFTTVLIEEAQAVSGEPLLCNQIEYHPYLDQDKVIARCRRDGIAVVAHSPIARGRTSGDERLAAIGARHRKTPAQVCLRWLVQQDVIAIPRTTRVERLSENFDILDFMLSPQEMAEISALRKEGGRVVNPVFAPPWD